MATKQNQAFLVNTEVSPFAALRPVSASTVELLDGFWARLLDINRKKTLQFQYQFLESTGRLDNIRRAARRLAQPFRGRVYDESDVYKWLEAAYWSLGRSPDPGLKVWVEAIIRDLEAAQQPDGYLNTYFVGETADDRWGNLKDQHELYCAGHLIQAGIAGRRAHGDDRLFNISVRFADHICRTFGPGKIQGVPGHPEIEMALVELYRETGESRYLELASYFVEARGSGLIGGLEYHQDHKPFRELERLTGHAVRALYFCAGAADLYLESGDAELREALVRLWNQMTSRQMYISGGVGGRAQGEAFGDDFELPNLKSYAETCAAIASLMWSWRMLQINADARYADLIETVLYNGMLVGMAGDGCGYFYRNPLASDGGVERASWFSTACCPPNLARTLAGLPGMLFSCTDAGVWIHHYASSRLSLAGRNGRGLVLKVETDYPWEGNVDITVEGAGEFDLYLRIPHWAGAEAGIEVNGEVQADLPKSGTYHSIRRDWSPGDQIRVSFPMKPRFVVSHPAVRANQGKMALQRGPLLYCLEEVDNPEISPHALLIKPQAGIRSQYSPNELGGVVILEGEGVQEEGSREWGSELYQEVARVGSRAQRPVRWVAVPYFAWANRGPGWMRVWVREGRD